MMKKQHVLRLIGACLAALMVFSSMSAACAAPGTWLPPWGPLKEDCISAYVYVTNLGNIRYTYDEHFGNRNFNDYYTVKLYFGSSIIFR